MRVHNIDRLRQALASHNWNALFSIDDDLDFLYEAFTNTLKAYYADFIPVKYVKMSRADPWFFSPLIKCLLHKRNILLHRGQTHKAAEISLKVNKLISEQRQKQLASVDSKNTKKLWHMIDESSQNRPQYKYSLNVDGHDALDMANDINEYFSKIATDDTYDLDSIQEAIANYTHVSADHSICTLNNFEVCKMLMSIKKTSSGPDDIPYWLLRECAVEIAPIVTFIFNKSLSLWKIPSAWKTAIITPLPKKKFSSISENFSNLRPISVTSILSRLLEKVIIQRFFWPGLCEEGCLEDQFGFRPTGSTTAALIDITNFIYSKFNEGSDYVRCLLIDYSRAFDTVDHSILFQELRALNLPLKIYNWIADFLTGRSQCVKLQSIRSALAAMSRSVVQGSRIGPYLYILLVRKLKTISFHNKIDKYADDTTLLVPQHSDISIETEFAHV